MTDKTVLLLKASPLHTELLPKTSI